MKPFLILCVVSILLALVAGGGDVWRVFFPVATEKNSNLSGTQVALMTSVVTDVNIVSLSASELWNIGVEGESVNVSGDSDLKSSWTVELKKDTWILMHKNDKENIWYFQGILYDNGQYSAVLYNGNLREKWLVVREKEYFEDLKVVKVTHEGITLQDSNQKEWYLGLFHRKQQSKQDKVK